MRPPLKSIAMLLALACCGAPPPVDEDERRDAGTPAPVDAGPPPPCEPAPPACLEEAESVLRFGTALAPGNVTNSPDGAGWVSDVDATSTYGHGAPRSSYLYARFDPATGLEKVAFTDADASRSLEWDIALRRTSLRINSGDSGPSCVLASRASPATPFDYVYSEAEALAWRTDDFFTSDCTLIPDGSGMGLPDTALSSTREYGACVEPTGHVFLLKLRSGRHVKLVVLSLYSEANQALCDAGQPVSFLAAGLVRLRWAFLD